MRIHAFKFFTGQNSQPIEDLFQVIQGHSLEGRIREENLQKIRVETITRRDNGYWLMDFVKFREGAGPGKSHPVNPTTGFDFEDDECFGEETAVLFIPAAQYFLVQYNHHGVKGSNIEAYFNHYSHPALNNYELLPKFEEDVERRFHTKSIIRKLQYSIASRYLSAGDKKAGLALSKALSMGAEYGGDKITVTISAARSNHLGLSMTRIWQTVSALKDLIKKDEKAIDKFEVTGKDNKRAQTEVLDFLGKRLCQEFDIDPGADKRLPKQDRWASLVSAYINWQQILT